jgi:hypothetical protein
MAKCGNIPEWFSGIQWMKSFQGIEIIWKNGFSSHKSRIFSMSHIRQNAVFKHRKFPHI